VASLAHRAPAGHRRSKSAGAERLVGPLLAALRDAESCDARLCSPAEPKYVLLHYLRTVAEWLLAAVSKPSQQEPGAAAAGHLQLLASVMDGGARWLSGLSLPPSLVQALAAKYGAVQPAAAGRL
jgi:hypothetical protein